MRVIKATPRTDYVIIKIILEMEGELRGRFSLFLFIKERNRSKKKLKATRKSDEGEGERGGGWEKQVNRG